MLHCRKRYKFVEDRFACVFVTFEHHRFFETLRHELAHGPHHTVILNSTKGSNTSREFFALAFLRQLFASQSSRANPRSSILLHGFCTYPRRVTRLMLEVGSSSAALHEPEEWCTVENLTRTGRRQKNRRQQRETRAGKLEQKETERCEGSQQQSVNWSAALHREKCTETRTGKRQMNSCQARKHERTSKDRQHGIGGRSIFNDSWKARDLRPFVASNCCYRERRGGMFRFV